MAQLLTIFAIIAALAELALRFAVLLQRLFWTQKSVERELITDPVAAQAKQESSPEKKLPPKKTEKPAESKPLPTESDKPLKTDEDLTSR